MKNQTSPVRRFSHRLALGALTLALIGMAGQRAATSAPSPDQGRQSGKPQTQTPPARPDSQRSGTPQRGPWWKDAAVIKEISLTPDQATRIDAIWKRRELEMHGAAVEHKKQQDELDRLVKERKVGPDVIGLQVDRVEAQRTSLNKSRTVMLYEFSLILSPEQNTALKGYFDRNRRERK